MPKKKEKEMFEGVADEEVAPTETIVAEEVEETKPVKKTRKKRVVTDEERERLRANLARGRATALANRQRKAQVKKIAKQEKVNEEEQKIVEHAKKRQAKNNALSEVEKLKAELKALREEHKAKTVKEHPPPKEPEPPKKLPKVVKKPNLENHTIKEEKKVAPKAERTPTPPPPKPKEPPALTQREILRMMRRL